MPATDWRISHSCAGGDVDKCGDLALPQLLQSRVLVVIGGLHGDPEALEQDRGGHGGAAPTYVHIDLLGSQIVELRDVSPCEDADLLVVKLGDVLNGLINAGMELSAPGIGEHIGLDDTDIDASQKQDVGDVLQRRL